MTKTEILAVALVGGLMPDVLRIVVLRTQGAPLYLKSAFFWASAVIMALLGAFACWLIAPDTALEAFAVGYSAPSILERLGGKTPDLGGGGGGGTGTPGDNRGTTEARTGPAGPASLRHWWGM